MRSFLYRATVAHEQLEELSDFITLGFHVYDSPLLAGLESN